MEELSRTHKDVPFGWALWVGQWLARRSRPVASSPPAARACCQAGRGDWPRLVAPR